ILSSNVSSHEAPPSLQFTNDLVPDAENTYASPSHARPPHDDSLDEAKVVAEPSGAPAVEKRRTIALLDVDQATAQALGEHATSTAAMPASGEPPVRLKGAVTTAPVGDTQTPLMSYFPSAMSSCHTIA